MSVEFVARAGDLALDRDGKIFILVEEVPHSCFADKIAEIDPAIHPWFQADLIKLQIKWALLNNEDDAHMRSYLAWAPAEPDPDADLHFARCEYREGAL